VNSWVTRSVLFLALFIALPLPMLGLDGVRVPAARFVQVAGGELWSFASHGAGELSGTVVALLALHAVLYTALLAAAVGALWHYALRRLPYRFRDHVTVISATLLILIGIYDELYETRFHAATERAGLLELYR